MHLKIEKEDGSTFVVGDVSEAELNKIMLYTDYLEEPTLSFVTDFAAGYDVVYETWKVEDPTPDDPLSSQFGPSIFGHTTERSSVAHVHSTLDHIHIEIVIPGYETSHSIPVGGELGLQVYPGGITQPSKLMGVLDFVKVKIMESDLDTMEKELRTYKATRLILKGLKAGREKVKVVQATVGGEVKTYVFDTIATLYTDSGAVLETWE